MTVYVDDSNIPAKVPNGRVVHDSRWCHLIADDADELHEFAERLGLKRSYFQPGKPRGDGSPSPHWHYDVTAGMRAKAVQAGAQEITWRESVKVIREREERAAVKEQDHAAGVAYKEGRYLDTARMLNEARKQFPNQAELWATRSDAVMARMRAANQTGRNDHRPLGEIVQERLERAGVKPSDPELTDLRNWNLNQLARDPNISNTPEPATDREAEA